MTQHVRRAFGIGLVVLGTTAAGCEAQTQALGVLLGPISTIQTRSPEEDSKSHAGFTVGAWADVATPRSWLSVTAEAAIARRGATYVLSDGFERQVDVDYLTAAVLPTLRASLGSVSLIGFAGPALDVLLRSQASLELQGAFRFGTGQVFAGIVGAGVEYRNGPTTFRLDGRINEQFSGAFGGDVDDVKHRSLEVIFRVGMRPSR